MYRDCGGEPAGGGIRTSVPPQGNHETGEIQSSLAARNKMAFTSLNIVDISKVRKNPNA
jgi:hypothetical protein